MTLWGSDDSSSNNTIPPETDVSSEQTTETGDETFENPFADDEGIVTDDELSLKKKKKKSRHFGISTILENNM